MFIRFRKIKLTLIFTIILFHLFANSENIKSKNDFLIQGEIDLKTKEIIENKLNEMNENELKLRSEIIQLQDKLISRSKDKVDINIFLIVDQKENERNYGIIQLDGSMNNISLIQYDHPILFNKKEKFPLFEGPLPLGEYEFKVSAIVGQQVEKWPFVLPEGKWSLEKSFKIEAHEAGAKKNIELVLIADKKTGLPQFELLNADQKK